jgi:hypothetical protein
MNEEAKKSATPGSQEPDIDQEESVPLDGRDVEGEELMKHVRNDRLRKPQPDPHEHKDGTPNAEAK